MTSNNRKDPSRSFGQQRLPLFDSDPQPHAVGSRPGDLSPHSLLAPLDPLAHLSEQDRQAPLSDPPPADTSKELKGYEHVMVEQAESNQGFVHHFAPDETDEFYALEPEIQLQEMRKQHNLPPVLHPDDYRAHPEWETVDLAIKRHLNIVDTFQPSEHTIQKETNTSVDDPTAQQDRYIDAYVSSGGMTKTALRKAGATHEQLKQWRQDSEFVERFNEAMEHWHEELRKAAFIRAQQKSDVLLIFMLKALKPDVYDDDIRKANWMAKQGLLGDQNLPVRATLVRDNTFNILLNGNATAPDGAALPSSRSTLLSDLPENSRLPKEQLRKDDVFHPDKELSTGEWLEVDEALNPQAIPSGSSSPAAADASDDDDDDE